MQFNAWLKDQLKSPIRLAVGSGLIGVFVVYMLIKIAGAGFAFGQHLAAQDDARAPSVQIAR